MAGALICISALLSRNRYKRYAFLRCDEEKEQFLYHLLSLNAVDYFCFTNTFHTTSEFTWNIILRAFYGKGIIQCPSAMLCLFFPVIPYRVIIFPSRKLSASTTSAQAWVQLAGSRGETSVVNIPKQQLQLVFQVSRHLFHCYDEP